MITLGTSEDELTMISPQPNRTTRKTYSSRYKPKGKSITDCNYENCKTNPLCTAWLGQATWDNTGESSRTPPPGPVRASAGKVNSLDQFWTS